MTESSHDIRHPRLDSEKIHIGGRDIDTRTVDLGTLTDTERKELTEVVLAMVHQAIEKENPDFELSVDGDWAVDEGSHGGLLFTGPDVYKFQKAGAGEGPGILVMIPGLADLGAHLARLLPSSHQGESVS